MAPYVTVKIPRELADIIDQHAPRFGYRSRAEFVTDAVREKLLELGFMPVRAASGPGRPEGAGPTSRPGRAQAGSVGRGPTGREGGREA